MKQLAGLSRVKMNALAGALDGPASYHRVDTARKRISIRPTEYAGNRQKQGCCGSIELPVVTPERS